MSSPRVIQDGGVFSVLGHALFGHLPVLEGNTRLFLDGNQVDEQVVDSVDGSYHYKVDATLGEHVCYVQYEGDLGEVESWWADFTVRKNTSTITVVATRDPAAMPDIGDDFEVRCNVTITDTDSSNQILPYGTAVLHEVHVLDGTDTAITELKVNDASGTGTCHRTITAKKGEYAYYWAYVDHRGHAESPHMIIHPVVIQVLYMNLEVIPPVNTVIAAGQVIMVEADIYTIDHDLSPDSLERTVVTTGTASILMDGTEIKSITDINSMDKKKWELPVKIPLGTHSFVLKFTGSAGTKEIILGDIEGIASNRIITLETTPPTDQIIGGRPFFASGTVTDAAGALVPDGVVELHQSSQLDTMTARVVAGTGVVASDGTWAMELIALSGPQTLQAVLTNSPTGVGVSATLSFTALGWSADTTWDSVPEHMVWSNVPSEITWNNA